MNPLPTLQEAIEAKARKKLLRNIIDFRSSIDSLCRRKEFTEIASAIHFRYGAAENMTAAINLLFYKGTVLEEVQSKLLPGYVEDEIQKTTEALNKIIKAVESEPCKEK